MARTTTAPGPEDEPPPEIAGLLAQYEAYTGRVLPPESPRPKAKIRRMKRRRVVGTRKVRRSGPLDTGEGA